MVRISGVVKIATIAREQLQLGILPQEVEKFQKFVTISVQKIDHLCAISNSHPSQLPTPSRKAYDFLKQIDLNNLPIAREQQQVQMSTLKLKNVIKQERILHQEIWDIAVQKGDPEEFLGSLNDYIHQIEQICDKNQLTPASLAPPSRSAYAWMKFLTQNNNLSLHLATLTRALEIAEQILSPKGKKLKSLFIKLGNFYLLYKCKSTIFDQTIVEMNEGFIYASDEVLSAVMENSLLQKNPLFIQKIRNFGISSQYSSVLRELDSIVEFKEHTGKGKFYDLDRLFDKINREYFAGLISKPALFWSDTLTTRKFGHYEPARDRIVISQTLDDTRIPEFVVEYVLYHELLHKSHGIKLINGKQQVHTPEFRNDEQKFKYYHQGEAYLCAIARGDYL